MDTMLYKRLINCNAEHCWHFVRDSVATQLMGEDVFPVPYIQDAHNFDMGHVVVRGRRSKMEILSGVRAAALPIGRLSMFVKHDPENDLMARMGSVNKDTELRLNQVYEYHVTAVKHDVKKAVTVQLFDCEKWAMDYIPKSGDLAVDLLQQGYANIDEIYLITEVHYVSKAKVTVTIGDQEDCEVKKGKIPIGFSLVKYKILPNGTLGRCGKVKIKKWHAFWIRNERRTSDQPPLESLYTSPRGSRSSREDK